MNPGPEVLAHQDSGIFDGEPCLARDPVWEAWSLALGGQGSLWEKRHPQSLSLGCWQCG